jgi:hypothetical protein
VKVLKDREWAAVYTQWKLDNPELAVLSQRLSLVRGCVRKVLYDNREEAMKVIEFMPVFPGKVLHCYLCEICAHWHIGNTKLWWLRRK